MFAQVHYPTEPLTHEELDLYLAEGWFRMGQTIFTTSFLNFNRQFYGAIWLRVILEDFVADKTLNKLSKLNAAFRVEVKRAAITIENETLFATYRESVPFEASDSLQQLLNGNTDFNIYDTREINLYDGDKLIAAGFFDMGKDSAAGITSFYDPAYRKHSLGKYMIYQKMLYCKNEGLQYFYPGYFAPGYAAFDYKLEIGRQALEYYEIQSKNWYSINNFEPSDNPITETNEKLKVIENQLEVLNIENKLLNYKYYDANLMSNLQGYQLFDYPQFIYCFDFVPEIVNPIIVYDVRDQRYHLIKCMSFGTAKELYDHTEEYSAHLLKAEHIVFSTPRAEDMVFVMATAVKSQ